MLTLNADKKGPRLLGTKRQQQEEGKEAAAAGAAAGAADRGCTGGPGFYGVRTSKMDALLRTGGTALPGLTPTSPAPLERPRDAPANVTNSTPEDGLNNPSVPDGCTGYSVVEDTQSPFASELTGGAPCGR